jgi:hypothetical protein
VPFTLLERSVRRDGVDGECFGQLISGYATPINPATVMLAFRAQQQKGDGSKFGSAG